MSNSVHVHSIIELIHTASSPYTRERLRAHVTARYGPEVRFHSCSADEMDFEQLIEFLHRRNKIRESDGVLYPGGAGVCNHS